MESTEIRREAKVYESLWNGGNGSRSSGFYFPVYTLYMSFLVQGTDDGVRYSTVRTV